MSQKELIEKADIALADLNSNGGLLSPEQNDRFIRSIIDQPTILREARTVTMNSPQRKINKIGFGSRILRPASQTSGSRALAAADRSKPDLGQVELNTEEVIAEIRLPYEVLEDNIERGDMTNTILDLIAERAALDIEELILLGDTVSADPYLALMDGILKRVSANTVNGTDVGITSDLFSNGIKALPTRYRRNKSLLRFLFAQDVEQDYRNALTQRGTSLGDAILTGSQALPVFGVPLRGAALMPYTNGLLTNPKNMIVGFQRNVRIETDKDISAREWIIVLTARLANQVEEDQAVVKFTNVGEVTP